MKLTGEEAASAVRGWIGEEIKRAPSLRADLGRFLFGVSSGTAGLVATLEKLGASPRMDGTLAASMLLLLVAIVLALHMALPRAWSIDGEKELFAEYNRRVATTVQSIWVWFACWTGGLVVGLLAVFGR